MNNIFLLSTFGIFSLVLAACDVSLGKSKLMFTNIDKSSEALKSLAKEKCSSSPGCGTASGKHGNVSSNKWTRMLLDSEANKSTKSMSKHANVFYVAADTTSSTETQSSDMDGFISFLDDTLQDMQSSVSTSDYKSKAGYYCNDDYPNRGSCKHWAYDFCYSGNTWMGPKNCPNHGCHVTGTGVSPNPTCGRRTGVLLYEWEAEGLAYSEPAIAGGTLYCAESSTSCSRSTSLSFEVTDTTSVMVSMSFGLDLIPKTSFSSSVSEENSHSVSKTVTETFTFNIAPGHSCTPMYSYYYYWVKHHANQRWYASCDPINDDPTCTTFYAGPFSGTITSSQKLDDGSPTYVMTCIETT